MGRRGLWKAKAKTTEQRQEVRAAMTGRVCRWVTSLGLEVTKASDADIDDDLLKSRPVQKSLENLRTSVEI